MSNESSLKEQLTPKQLALAQQIKKVKVIFKEEGVSVGDLFDGKKNAAEREVFKLLSNQETPDRIRKVTEGVVKDWMKEDPDEIVERFGIITTLELCRDFSTKIEDGRERERMGVLKAVNKISDGIEGTLALGMAQKYGKRIKDAIEEKAADTNNETLLDAAYSKIFSFRNNGDSFIKEARKDIYLILDYEAKIKDAFGTSMKGGLSSMSDLLNEAQKVRSAIEDYDTYREYEILTPYIIQNFRNAELNNDKWKRAHKVLCSYLVTNGPTDIKSSTEVQEFKTGDKEKLALMAIIGKICLLIEEAGAPLDRQISLGDFLVEEIRDLYNSERLQKKET